MAFLTSKLVNWTVVLQKTCSRPFSKSSAFLSRNHRILGVSRNATVDEIKEAYFKKCLLIHPDKSVKSLPNEKMITKEFTKINMAYKELLQKKTMKNTAAQRFPARPPLIARPISLAREERFGLFPNPTFNKMYAAIICWAVFYVFGGQKELKKNLAVKPVTTPL